MSCQQRIPLRTSGRSRETRRSLLRRFFFARKVPSLQSRFLLSMVVGLILLPGCENRSIQKGDLLLSSRPAALPDGFPRELVYRDSRVEMLGQLDTAGFWSPAQYAVSFRTEDDGDSVRAHYMQFLHQEHWQILQSRHFDAESKTIIVAESPMQRIMTLIIPDGPASVVQLYLKRSTDN